MLLSVIAQVTLGKLLTHITLLIINSGDCYNSQTILPYATSQFCTLDNGTIAVPTAYLEVSSSSVEIGKG